MKTIKKADIILAIFFIVIGVGMSIFLATNDENGSKALVYVDGELFGTYSLEKNQEIEIKKDEYSNTLEIKGGYIYMKCANCESQDCVNMGKISRKYETVVCLPHRVMVRIKEANNQEDNVEKKQQIDAISN